MARIAKFAGMQMKTARHIPVYERNSERPAIFASGNLWSRTGAMRKRPGFAVQQHNYQSTLVWPDTIGRLRATRNRIWNFSGAGKINIDWDDYDSYPDFHSAKASLSAPGASSVATYRFRHIALAIDERRDMLGLPASGLPTTTKDDSIAYTDINAARAQLDTILIASFVFNTLDLDTGVQSYSTIEAMLDHAAVGGPDPDTTTTEWTCVDSTGATTYRNDLLSTDKMNKANRDTYFSEIETVLTSCFTHTQHSMSFASGQPGQYVGNQGNSPEEAWAAAFNWAGNSADGWCAAIKTSGVGIYNAAKIVRGHEWSVGGLSVAYSHRIKTVHKPAWQIGGSIPYFNLSWTEASSQYFDFSVGGLMPNYGKWYVLYESASSADATISGDYNADGVFELTQPSVVDKYFSQSLRYVGSDGKDGVTPDWTSLAEWTFPEDANLGTTDY